MTTRQTTRNYRLITGPDDAHFCDRVSDARADGWELYGDPSIAITADRATVAQALVKPIVKETTR